MPLEIIRSDITNMQVDAIVNTANPRPLIGLGVDSRIHEKAGSQLLEARLKIGAIQVGSAAITPGFRLPARHVIHTVGPVWDGGSYGEELLLRSCYDNALRLALENECRSVAFPLISAGNYGFPRDKALKVALMAFGEFLLKHEMMIFLVLLNREAVRLSEKLFWNVASYIDENYTEGRDGVPGGESRYSCKRMRREREDLLLYRENLLPTEPDFREIRESGAAFQGAGSLADMLRQEDAGFTETLLRLIDERGKRDPEVYRRANISRQHFSKIRNNVSYRPSKATAVALALALELNWGDICDLVGRAGYALNNASKFDLIIRYFVEQGVYDVMQINLVLYDFDQPLLGA